MAAGERDTRCEQREACEDALCSCSPPPNNVPPFMPPRPPVPAAAQRGDAALCAFSRRATPARLRRHRRSTSTASARRPSGAADASPHASAENTAKKARWQRHHENKMLTPIYVTPPSSSTRLFEPPEAVCAFTLKRARASASPSCMRLPQQHRRRESFRQPVRAAVYASAQ